MVAYNSGATLERCLSALVAQTMPDFEVVVVDNASDDDAVDRCLPDDPRFAEMRLSANVGFAAANNRAAEGATLPLLALVNPDAFLEPDWLERMMAAVDRYPWADSFASVQLSASDPSRLDGLGDCYFMGGVAWRGGIGQPVSRPTGDRRVFGACAAAAVYRTDRFLGIGGFDERLFCILEDVDLAFRLRLTGGDCVLVADAVVQHVGSATIGTQSAFAVFHIARNQTWVFVKNMPIGLLVALLPVHCLVVGMQFLRNLRRGRSRSALRGLARALAGLGAVLRARAGVQTAASVGHIDIARSLTWAPQKLRRHLPDLRNLPDAV